jgi:hypothetical protein
MDTRPKHEELAAPKTLIEQGTNASPGTPCPRERFLRQARKPDDGDCPRGHGGPEGPPPYCAIAEEG